jgi:hypothetical protein
MEVNFYTAKFLPIFKGLIFSEDFKLRLGFLGKVNRSFLELQGYPLRDPARKIAIGLTKRAKLP